MRPVKPTDHPPPSLLQPSPLPLPIPTTTMSPPKPPSLPLPLYLTLFFSVSYFLLLRCRHKILSSTPLHILSLSELAAILSLLASFIYLFTFFAIGFLQSHVRHINLDHTTRNNSKPKTKHHHHFQVHDSKLETKREYDNHHLLDHAQGGVKVHHVHHDRQKLKFPTTTRDHDHAPVPAGGGVYAKHRPKSVDGILVHALGVQHPKLKAGSVILNPNELDEDHALAPAPAGGGGDYAKHRPKFADEHFMLDHALGVQDSKLKAGSVILNPNELDEDHARAPAPAGGGGDYAKHRPKFADEQFMLDHVLGVQDSKLKPGSVILNPEGKGEGEEEEEQDEEIVRLVVSGAIPSYSLETRLGDCSRAAWIRRQAVELKTGRSLEGLPMEGFDYRSILGQCCEMPIGFVQVPVGIAGPLLVNGGEYMVPMATTEGCLVASTNRGCKAVYSSGGACAVLLRDGMSRAPVVRFGTAARAAQLKFFLEDRVNFDTLSLVFNKSSRFARLQSIQCSIAGKNLYIRFTCSTGDAMGMNMVSKGVQNVLDFLRIDFPDMDVIGISGNYCSDKKPAAVNWIEGRGKSVVCEAVITEEVVRKVLKTTVPALVELNMLKNLAGSAVAGSLGGFNAHAANIVSAIFIATGQDPAQNIESSHCITMMEAVNGGKDLHVSVTMPSIEVGTVGGGTQLASQAACLNLLGVKGASKESPGSNARLLATIVAGSVLAGELSLMAAISEGQLVKSHMKYNRSNHDMTAITS